MNKFRRRVVVIEHDQKFRDLVCAMIGVSGSYVLINQYDECEEALKQVKRDFPDIIIMDVDFPQMKGTEAISKLKALFPQVMILIVTDYEEAEIIFGAFNVGANGYILKKTWAYSFINHLDELSKGGAPLSPNIAKVIVESLRGSRMSPLTSRENQVLKLITSGDSYSRIASELNISKETSKTHIRNIYRKLNVKSKSEVVRKAFEERLVSYTY